MGCSLSCRKLTGVAGACHQGVYASGELSPDAGTFSTPMCAGFGVSPHWLTPNRSQAGCVPLAAEVCAIVGIDYVHQQTNILTYGGSNVR